jgi:hypothetical protein
MASKNKSKPKPAAKKPVAKPTQAGKANPGKPNTGRNGKPSGLDGHQPQDFGPIGAKQAVGKYGLGKADPKAKSGLYALKGDAAKRKSAAALD